MNQITQAIIPDKLYFRIGEVSRIVGVKPYVLRYWETEFAEIRPAKSRSGQRLYRRKDVENLVSIKKLLYDEKFTILGARKRLKELNREAKEQVKAMQVEAFPEVCDDVAELAAEVHKEVKIAVEQKTPIKQVFPRQTADVAWLKKIKEELVALLAEIRR